MKYLKLSITVAALILYLGCKKDHQYDEYLKLKYHTVSAGADTTIINIAGNTPLISTNVTTPEVSQDGGAILGVSGTVADNTAVLKIVTPRSSKGWIYVKWIYNNGRVANIPFMKSKDLLNTGY